MPRGRRSRDRSIVEQCVTMRNIARSIASRETGDVARDVAGERRSSGGSIVDLVGTRHGFGG